MPLNRGWSYREQVGPEASGQTVLAYLSATRLHSTEQEWTARLDRGEVEVEGARVRRDTVLFAGQTVVWHRPPWDEPTVPTHFDVIHEDDAIVVVNKPSGLPTMPAGGFLDQTLLALVRKQHPEASPLHRLGRCTSGLVLFARTREAASRLARAWREHLVKKTYRAVGLGATRAEMFVIDVPIGSVPHPTIGTIQAACEGGKPSHSVAVVLETRHDQTLFSVEITTGRPHQIRIHMAYAGHPLVGDPIYEAGGGVKRHPGLPGDGGYLLHAERLQFLHPITGQRMSVTATPPPELQTHAELVSAGSAMSR
ncbi:MAG TPA: RluA family pseudouridine synthase [Vicinamibacterales bacterium]|nr:RluA family pseudouridine synthase [Vicinamibacterales bacterium]